MKWKIYKKIGGKVINSDISSGYIQEFEENYVLNENWCEDYSFTNEFNSPEEAFEAFKELCKSNQNTQYKKSYTDMEMVCLPSFSITYFDLEQE